MLTDGGSETTGPLPLPTMSSPSIPACRWPGKEQKHEISPLLSARKTVTLLAPFRATLSVPAPNSGKTTSCSTLSLLIR